MQYTKFNNPSANDEKPLLLSYHKYISPDISEKYVEENIATTWKLLGNNLVESNELHIIPKDLETLI